MARRQQQQQQHGPVGEGRTVGEGEGEGDSLDGPPARTSTSGKGAHLAASSSGPAENKRRRHRTVLSCVACHRRKQRCDRGRPCKSCTQRDSPEGCRYEDQDQDGDDKDDGDDDEEGQSGARAVELEHSYQRQAGPSGGPSRPGKRKKDAGPGQDMALPGVAHQPTPHQVLLAHHDFEHRDPLTTRIERLEDMLKLAPSLPPRLAEQDMTLVRSQLLPPPPPPPPLLLGSGPGPGPGPGPYTAMEGYLDSTAMESDLDAITALNQLARGQAEAGVMANVNGNAHGQGQGDGATSNVYEWMKHLPQTQENGDPDLFLFDSGQSSGIQTLRSIARQLPDRERSDDMLDCFFQQWHPFYDVLNEQEYRSDYAHLWERLFHQLFRSPNPLRDEEVASYALDIALLTSILAIGAHFETDFIDSAPDVLAKQMDYLSKRALNLCPIPIASAGAISTDPIKYMQILTYQWCYLEQTGKIAESWEVIGRGVRIAQGLGMHRDMRHLNIMSPREIAQRERHWWTIFRADRMSSVLIGFPYGIEERHCDVPDPEASKGIPLDQFDYVECLRYEVELARLTGSLTDCQLRPSPLSFKEVMAMEEKISLAMKSMPSKYTLDSGISATQQTTSLLHFKTAIIHVLQHAGYLALHQRFIYQSSGDTGCTAAEVEYSRKVAVDHAVKLLNFQLDLLHLFFLAPSKGGPPRFRYLRWFNAVFFVFAPAIILCIHLIRTPSLADPKWLALVEQADHALQRLENINPIARSAARVLSILKARAKIFLKRQADLEANADNSTKDSNESAIDPQLKSAANAMLRSSAQRSSLDPNAGLVQNGGLGLDLGHAGPLLHHAAFSSKSRAESLTAANAMYRAFVSRPPPPSAPGSFDSAWSASGPEGHTRERRKGRHYGLRPDSRGWPSMIDLLHYGGIARMAPSDWHTFFESVSGK